MSVKSARGNPLSSLCCAPDGLIDSLLFHQRLKRTRARLIETGIPNSNILCG